MAMFLQGMITKRYLWILYCLLPVILAGCKSNMLFRSNPRDVYSNRLQRAGLDNSALGAEWFAAAERSLVSPLEIGLPYLEKGFFPPDKPLAFGYRFRLPEGQKLSIHVATRSANKARVFTELWRLRDNHDRKLLEFTDSADTITYEANEDEVLLLRLQPELASPVSYTLTVITGPSLAFPVHGGSNRNIGSVWGDPRNGGSRRHEGIDIFAKRGTPVVAAAPGIVTSVREGGLGGKTVWMKPAGKNISLYYAHLDSQLVTAGQQVEAGDTLGLMGNTGNARTTAPHLHFGIYRLGGAVNSMPYVRQQKEAPAPVNGKEELFGMAARTISAQQLYPSSASKKDGPRLDRNTYVTITAATANLYKVSLPGGGEGFLPVRSVTTLERSIETITTDTSYALLFSPVANSAVMGIANTKRLPVKARYKGYVYVGTDSLRGWLPHKE